MKDNKIQSLSKTSRVDQFTGYQHFRICILAELLKNTIISNKKLNYYDKKLQVAFIDFFLLFFEMRDYCDLAEGIWEIIQTAGTIMMLSRGVNSLRRKDKLLKIKIRMQRNTNLIQFSNAIK